jgi:DNA-binding NtrC family response regulator
MRLLRRQRWEDNILDLKAYIRNALLITQQGLIQERENLQVMKMIMLAEDGDPFSLQQSLSVIENEIISRALAANLGHASKTARLLAVSERSFNRRINPS